MIAKADDDPQRPDGEKKRPPTWEQIQASLERQRERRRPRREEMGRLIDAQISLLPISIDGTKTPYSHLLPLIEEADGSKHRSWKPFTTRFMTPDELDLCFLRNCAAPAAIGGEISGHLELLDFDRDAETIFPLWCHMVRERAPGLLERLTIHKTPRPGYRPIYRCTEVKIPGNEVIAERIDYNPETGEVLLDEKGKPKIVAMVETRGEGGYAVIPGGPRGTHKDGAYEHFSGPPLVAVSNISAAERQVLWECAATFNQVEKVPQAEHPKGTNGSANGIRAGDDYNERGPGWLSDELLGGWKAVCKVGKLAYVRRPGKEHGWSGTLGLVSAGGVELFRCHTSSASPLTKEQTYDKFGLYAALHHGSDFTAARKALKLQGYGPQDEEEKDQQQANGQQANRQKATPPPNGQQQKTASGERLATKLPSIQWNDRQLREVTADALAAIMASNTPPQFFQRLGLLNRLRECPVSGSLVMEPLVDAKLRGVLARVANWFSVKEIRGKAVWRPTSPSADVVSDITALPKWPGIPYLESIVDSPVFDGDGSLVVTPGYHPEARLWLQLPPQFRLPPIPDRPTPNDIRAAREILLTELWGDFPFTDNASRATALAALLLPFVRQMIPGPTPLHLFDAPTAGTGKGLLIETISIVALGKEPPILTECSSDEEWKKTITSKLIEGKSLLLLDNLNRELDSASLAAVLTSIVWTDRILGTNNVATVPNRALWLASGNNVVLSHEMVRRTVWCRIDSKQDAPWDRTGFRHSDLPSWARENRPRLVAACLTLCQAWIAAGRPAGKETIGTFVAWAKVMGGILGVAGVPGLLTNARAFRASRVDKGSEWRAFVSAWDARHGEDAVGVKELFDLAIEESLLDKELGYGNVKSQRTRLGIALGQAADRVFGARRIERVEPDHSGVAKYRLLRAGEQQGKFSA